MRLLAIDPGSEESALLIYNTETREPTWFEKVDNEQALALIAHDWRRPIDRLAVEKPVARGMPASNQLFETCVWIGRFIERWDWKVSKPWEYVDRAKVKLHVCHDSRAKDSNIRAALVDRWGGKERAIGKKATPGPLYGISGDVWAALGVAVTVADR